LKVFDILGNKINTLVNEVKTSGNYEVEFDASNFASGIYFYCPIQLKHLLKKNDANEVFERNHLKKSKSNIINFVISPIVKKIL